MRKLRLKDWIICRRALDSLLVSKNLSQAWQQIPMVPAPASPPHPSEVHPRLDGAMFGRVRLQILLCVPMSVIITKRPLGKGMLTRVCDWHSRVLNFQELRNAQSEQLMGIRREEEMEMSDDETCDSPTKKMRVDESGNAGNCPVPVTYHGGLPTLRWGIRVGKRPRNSCLLELY